MAGYKSLLSIFIMVFAMFSPWLARAGQAPEGKTVATDGEVKAARNEVGSGSYSQQAGEFRDAVIKVYDAALKAKTAIAEVKSLADLEKIKSSSFNYAHLHSTCVNSQATASTLCFEETNPNLQETLNQINTIGSLIAGAAISDSCSTLAKMARIGIGGLTAYTASCSAARGTCEASCANVKSNIDRIKALHAKVNSTCTPEPLTNTAAQTACSEYATAFQEYQRAYEASIPLDSDQKDDKSIAIRDVACTYQYKSMLASAGAGITSMISSFKQGQKCEEDTKGDSNLAANLTLEQKCALPENEPLQECICFKNPRTAGCGNSFAKLDAGGDDIGGAFIGESSTPESGGVPDLGNNTNIDLGDRNPSSAGAAPGAPTGGGSAGLGGGGGGGSGGGAGGDAAAGKSTPEYSTGFEGGGGGGRGGGGRSGSSADTKYRSYLPGGDKDPRKAMAGSEAWKKEVTSQAGKSNFEKVRERYRDNNTTLLNK